MKLNERQKKIIETLAETKTSLTGNYLGRLLSCTSRTIRSDIKKINEFYSNDNRLIASTINGYVFLNREENVFLAHDLSFEKRIISLYYFENITHIVDLAIELETSEYTIINYIPKVNLFLKPFNLEMEMLKSEISIKGNTHDLTLMIQSILQSEIKKSFFEWSLFQPYFKTYKLKQIEEDVNTIFEKNNYDLPNWTLINIILRICLFQRNEYVFDVVEIDSTEPLINISFDISEYFYEINPSVDKIKLNKFVSTMIMVHLRKIKTKAIRSENNEQEIILILEKIFNDLNLQIEQNKTFYAHVVDLIQRYHTSPKVTPFIDRLSNIKYEIPVTFELAVLITEKLEQSFSIDIPDFEIDFLALHLQYLLKEGTVPNQQIKVIILGQNYLNVFERIKELLERLFFLQIYQIDLEERVYLKSEDINYDVIVALFNPNLYLEKIVQIKHTLNPEDINKLTQAIQSTISKRYNDKLSENLKRYFSEELFISNIEFATKYDCIKYCTNYLYEKGYVKKTFKTNVIKREELSSTNFGLGYAIPHSTLMDANETKVLVCVPDQAIEWDSGDMVHIVFLIIVNSNDRLQFMQLYECLVKSLNEELAIWLSKSRSFENFKATLRKILE